VLSSLDQYCFVATRFVVTLYAAHAGASSAVIGVLIALYGIGGTLISVGAGRWVDRVGTRIPLVVTSGGMVLAGAVFYLNLGVPGLFIISALQGVLYNTYYIAQQLLLGRYGTRDQHVRNYSLAALGTSAANFLAPMLSGFLIDRGGYGWAFAPIALLPLLPTAFIAAGRLPMTEPQPPSERRDDRLLDLLRDRELRIIYIYSAAALGAWQTMLFLLPLYGVAIGLNAFHNGLMVSTFPIASMLSRLATPLLTRRFTSWQILIGSLAASALGMALLPFLHSVVPLALVSFWLGLALGTCNPVGQALLYQASPPGREGMALSLWALFGNLMQALTPLAFGAVSGAVGVGPVFWLLTAALVACCYTGRDRLSGRRSA
jgi:MFS family permease